MWMYISVHPHIFYIHLCIIHTKNCPRLTSKAATTQTQNKTRQNYYASPALIHLYVHVPSSIYSHTYKRFQAMHHKNIFNYSLFVNILTIPY